MEYKSLERNSFSRSPNLLERSPFSPDQNQGGSSLQKQVDGLVEGFVRSATDWHSLAAMMAGGMAFRVGRVGLVSSTVGAQGPAPLHALSIAAGLTAEVSAFELTYRTLESENLDLWKWNGPHGLAQGLLQSFITFGTLKSAGHFARGENVVIQHLLQDSAMVAGHQFSAAFNISPRPAGTLAEQFLNAEATNLQLGAGAALVHRLSGGRLMAVEKTFDLSMPHERSTPSLSESSFSGFTEALATPSRPFLFLDSRPTGILSVPIKEAKGPFREWLENALSLGFSPRHSVKNKTRLSEEDSLALAEDIRKNLMREDREAHDGVERDAYQARSAMLQTGGRFAEHLEKSLSGLSTGDSNLPYHFFIRALGWRKIPELKWPLDARLISEQQIQNVFLWPLLHRLSSHPAFQTAFFPPYRLLFRFPYSSALEEMILTLDALKIQGSWGPSCDVTSFPYRNRGFNRLVVKVLLPLLKKGEAPLKIHAAGDSLGLNGLEIMLDLNRKEYPNIEVISTDALEREIYYLYQQERIAVFDKQGNLLLLKKGDEIHSNRDPPSRKEVRELKARFKNFDLKPEENVYEDGDARLQRIRLVHPRAEEALKYDPTNFRLATVNMMDSASLQLALRGEADLVLLFNVINQERFSEREARRALQSLGRGLKEGAFLAVGFREAYWSRRISSLNIFQRKGNQMVRVRTASNPFSPDVATDFESLPLE